MTPDDAAAFFTAYRDAFNRLDGDAVAALWHTPSGITDSHGEGGAARLTWWAEEAPMRANHRALCAVYAKAGYGRADFELTACTPMGANHGFAHLQWTIRHQDGHVMQRFGTGYELLRTADGWRVLLAVAHAEDLAALGR